MPKINVKLEYLISKTQINILVNIKIIIKKDMEYIISQIIIYIKENLKEVKEKVMDQ